MNEFKNSLLNKFKESYNKDSQFIKPWMLKWEYQDNLNKRDLKYSNELPQDFYNFQGIEDIKSWMNWGKEPKPTFFKKSILEPLIEKSEKFDKYFFKEYNLKFDFDNYSNDIGLVNAQDFLIGNIVPQKNDSGREVVLDFGSGYGRQANLWTQLSGENYLHISMDAIPKSYCLQYYYYGATKLPFKDYIDHPNSLIIDNSSLGIYHLPTWRFDLIPDNFVDKIMLVQVIQELNGKLAKYILNEFKRILKPNGNLIIRDHGNAWRPAHRIDIDRYLTTKLGFTLEYKMHAEDKIDIHGIPRVFKITNPKVEKQELVGVNQRLEEFKRDVDAATGGKLKKIIKGITKK